MQNISPEYEAEGNRRRPDDSSGTYCPLTLPVSMYFSTKGHRWYDKIISSKQHEGCVVQKMVGLELKATGESMIVLQLDFISDFLKFVNILSQKIHVYKVEQHVLHFLHFMASCEHREIQYRSFQGF